MRIGPSTAGPGFDLLYACALCIFPIFLLEKQAKKSLQEIRQLYYRLKDDVFASPRFGMAYNTSALEELLVDLFGTEMTMEHDSHSMPKYVCLCVYKMCILNKNLIIAYDPHKVTCIILKAQCKLFENVIPS